MLKNVRVICSCVVVVLCVLGAITNYMSGNIAAMNANIIAVIGWWMIAAEDVIQFFADRKSKS